MAAPVGIIGCPGSGKTFKARQLAARAVAETGAPLLVVDTGRVEIFDDMEHQESLEEVVDLLWDEQEHACYTPKGPEDFERLMGAVYAGRRVVLVIDELYNVMPSVRSVPVNLQKCLREWRRVLSGCFITSQLYRDCGRVLRGLVSEWYIFRMIAPEDRADLSADYGLDSVQVGNLPPARENPDGAYIHKIVGFAA